MERKSRLLRAAHDRQARKLRQDMSRTEWRLWDRLRGRQLLDHKFRRQVPFGPYFADFACLAARLVVEVDGEHHSDQLVYDARRDKCLGEMGYRVLRFWVSELDENLEGVVATIAEALSRHDVDGPPPTSPRAAGGGRNPARSVAGSRGLDNLGVEPEPSLPA